MLLLGAAGDLATRYVFPALARLHYAQLLPTNFEVTGIARRDWSEGDFREFVGERLDEHAGDVSEEARASLLESLSYRKADITDKGEMSGALGGSQEPALAYLALPPGIFPAAIQALSGMPEGSGIVVEKPFGEDLKSARELNRLLHDSFPEEDVLRADHFLGMKGLQNILALRFENRLFREVWSRKDIESVEVVWDETLALEGRAGYYDEAGALKDLIQNHLLQTLCMLAMEEPTSMGADDLRDAKLALLKSIKRLSPTEVEGQTVRARYSSGEVGGREVPAYTDEEGVDASRATETFAQVTLEVENERWAGVPFTLRTGKALAKDRQEILVKFRESRGSLFGGREQNVLRFPFEKGDIGLEVNVACDGDGADLTRTELSAEFVEQRLPAYSMLLLRALRRDPTFFVRDDEAEESWRVVEQILASWNDGKPELVEYPAGSEGPG